MALSPQRIELLREAAECRLDMKAAAILARSRVTGWTQALYEALFRGLGYKQNTWAMQCLAESIVPSFLRKESLAESPEHLQAILLGVAGLLPHNTTKTLDPFLKKLWAIWWRERSTYESRMLPKKAWRFHGIRPANHPQRRLALAAHWVARQDLARHLDDWFHSEDGTSGLPLRLNQILNPENPEFWSHHWTFRAPRIPGAQKMLGSSRTTDLAINAILPWFRARALSGNNSDLSQKVRDIYFNWPAAQDNLLLRKTRQRLIPGMLPRKIDSASLQQGLIQIASDFCSHTNAACEDCRFPELVRAMARGPEGE